MTIGNRDIRRELKKGRKAMFESWGRWPRVSQNEHNVSWKGDVKRILDRNRITDDLTLPVGLGRSYGDSCLNDSGSVMSFTRLDRLIEFDATTGVLRCESGVSLSQILLFALPRGWFLPVTPGTKYVTVGGAIANDVHGKNHHQAGTFGRYIRSFTLRRSDGSTYRCSPTEHSQIFAATIGGLGLTGSILDAEISLVPCRSGNIDTISRKFNTLDEFFSISRELGTTYQYTVAWLDCLTPGKAGRGIFMAGNHATEGEGATILHKRQRLSVPCVAPELLLCPLAMRLFNSAYFHKQLSKQVVKSVHYDPFFYPLDAVGSWNLLYGKRGFFQFQCVLEKSAFSSLFDEIVAAGTGSFLAVLKEFGSMPSPGMLSFPRPGVTLALDFANRGNTTLRLLERLDSFVRQHGGRVYPAKDATMSPESFRSYYPNYKDFQQFIDPGYSSSFARRVGLI